MPKPVGAPLPADVLADFAIFRRAALPSDEPPADQLLDGGLVSQLYNEDELASYYPVYVRQLARLAARRYFVVPAFAQANKARAECLELHVNRAELLQQQHRRAVEPLYCLIEVPERKGTSAGCEPFAAIDLSTRVFGASDFLREPMVELVPDGVAAVRISYRGHAPIAVAVSENAFAFIPPPPPASVEATLRRLQGRLFDKLTPSQQRSTLLYNRALIQTDPTRLEWLNRTGGLVRAIEPPTKESLRANSIGGIRAPIGG